MRKKYLAICWMISSFLWADTDLEREMKVANQIFEAGDYPKAYQAYTALLDLPLVRWQKEIVEYNRGNALLAQKKWKEALNQFQIVNVFDGSSLLLVRSLNANKAFAKLFQGIEVLTSQEIREEDRYSAALYLFRSAIRNAEEAKKVDCRLQILEGLTDCAPDINIQTLIKAARMQLANTLEDYEAALIKYAPVEQEILLLISGIKAIDQNLEFLQQHVLTESQKLSYLKFFIQQAKSWLPLWEDVTNDIAADLRKDLSKAREQFDRGLRQFDQGNLSKSQGYLHQSQNFLSQILQHIWGGDPLSIILERIRQTYQNIALQDPLPLLGISNLLEELNQLRERIPKEQALRFQKAIEDLERSLSALKESHPILSRFYFEEVGQNIKLILKDAKHEIEGPMDILQEGIEKQRFALKMTRLGQDLEEQNHDNIQQILLSRQSQVVVEAQKFLESAIKQQEEEFSQGSKTRIHAQRWGEVVALVSEGYRKAEQSEQLLREKGNEEQASSLQEQVIEDWFKALQKLKNLKESQQEEKMQENAPSSQPEEKEASMEEVIKVAQELDKSDRAIRPALPPISQGDRPW